MTSLPNGIHSIVAFDGAVEVVCLDEETLSRVSVRAGDTVVPVSPVAGPRRRPGHVAGPDVLRGFGARASNGTPVRALINTDPKWCVSGGTTLGIWFDEPHDNVTIAIAPAEDKPLAIEPDRAHRVEALVANHRMMGTFSILVLDERGRVLATVPRAIRRENVGGPSAVDHAVISEVVPAHPKARALAFRFEVEALAEAAAKAPPVLFFSELRVVRHDGGPALPPPLRLGQPGRGGVVGRADVTATGEAPLLVTLGADGEGGEGGSVELQVPGGRIHGRQSGTHTLDLLANTPRGTYTLYIDGAFVGSLSIGERLATVPIPARYLNDTERTIEIRDRYGLRPLYRGFAVLSGLVTPYTTLQREGGRPLPVGLAAPARYRYAALEAALAAAPAPETALQIVHAHKILGLGFEALTPNDIRPLAFPEVAEPDVSVIIPAHNKFEITYHGLCALKLARTRASFEIIVVDDGSSDRTTELADIVGGIKVIRNDTPQRFIRACNAGVAAARGRYVVLLNNDTEVTVGWLDALIDPFERFEGVGVTGAKLIYPDGTLQDAGGIVWRSGNPWNYGRGGNPLDPRYSYVREADYLSGAALMTTRAIWDEVGGLSALYEPMYFEDTDFAFKVRAAGYKTLFAPAAVVYHHEGQTSGTEVTTGMKAYQEVNRPKFKKTWAAAFRAFGPEGGDPDLEKDRGILGRVLFIDYALPRPDRDAGSYAAWEEMKLVQSLGFKVTFVPRNLMDFGHYKSDLEDQGIEVITAPFAASVNQLLEDRGREFDVVYITRYAVARDFTDAVRRHAPRAKIMLMNADLHFLREVREAIASGDPGAFAKAEATREDELAAMSRVDLTLSYNEVEHAVIQSHALGAIQIAKCPWVVRVRDEVPPFEARRGTAFLGGFRHPPNRSAVTWFVDNVVPGLAAKGVGGDFHVYGSAMPDEIRELEGGTVKTPGFIENVDELYDRHRIFVAPLIAGAGLKGKVVGALAAGIPCVLSPVAAEGIGLRTGYDCLIAREPAEWVDAIARLDGNPALWATLSKNGRALVEAQYSFAAGRELMREAFNTVGIFDTL